MENIIEELAEQIRKNEEEITNINIILSLKDFIEKQGYEIHIETYLNTGNKYLVIKKGKQETYYELEKFRRLGVMDWRNVE